jgi:drug/metabolite transporter (DMT)-like permease
MLAAALWGLSGTAAKYLFTSTQIPPFLLVQVRMGLSALLLFGGLALLRPHLLRVPPGGARSLGLFGILGMAMVQFTYLLAIAEANVATAIFLQYLSPILTALYAWLFIRQRLGGLLWGCLALAMVGSFLLLFGGTTRLLVTPLGLTAGLASAGFMSFYTIYGAHMIRRTDAWGLLAYGLGIGFLFWLAVDVGLLTAGIQVEGLHLLTDKSLWLFFGYVATLATIIPFGLYLQGLRTLTPTQATITGMLEPVVGGLAAFWLLGERLLPSQVMGGSLIVAAVVLLQTGRQRTTKV